MIAALNSCFLFADDVVHLNPSVTGLQEMLNNCVSVREDLSMVFNCHNSFCLTFGKLVHAVFYGMFLRSFRLQWVSYIKHLGAHVVRWQEFNVQN